MNMANEYIDRGPVVSGVANLLCIPRCRFYQDCGSSESPLLSRGSNNTSFILMKDCNEIFTVDNSIVINKIEKIPSREHVC